MALGVDDVSKMREKILAVEKSEKGAEQLLRYYLQMSAMDCKLPINENQVFYCANFQLASNIMCTYFNSLHYILVNVILVNHST